MDLVIDFNALRTCGPLESFLSETTGNRAILTDMMGIECLKRDTVANYRQSFSVLSKYPRQVLLLKPFVELCRLRPQRDSFRSSLVNEELTESFAGYCRALLDDSNPCNTAIIEADQAKVKKFMETAKRLVDQELRQAMSNVAAEVPPKKLSLWRSIRNIQDEERELAWRLAAGITQTHYKQFFPNDPPPERADAWCWVPFRYNVALQALTLRWIKDGNHTTAPAHRLRNDSVDIFYVAYGSIFDGVLTEDKKLLELLQMTNDLLQYSSGCRSRHQPERIKRGWLGFGVDREQARCAGVVASVHSRRWVVVWGVGHECRDLRN